MRQMGISKRIIIVASENVQDNFKLQLFDERKLKLIDGIWNIRACTGNKLLQEINPMNMKGMPKDKVISQIKNLINTYYIFLGYGQFANYIIKTMNYTEEDIQKKINLLQANNFNNDLKSMKIAAFLKFYQIYYDHELSFKLISSFEKTKATLYPRRSISQKIPEPSLSDSLLSFEEDRLMKEKTVFFSQSTEPCSESDPGVSFLANDREDFFCLDEEAPYQENFSDHELDNFLFPDEEGSLKLSCF
jgi:hypothetical protein